MYLPTLELAIEWASDLTDVSDWLQEHMPDTGLAADALALSLMRPEFIERVGDRVAARFWSKALITNTDACWGFDGTSAFDGYPRFNITATKPRVAHRLMYEALVGEVPDGLQLDHLCRNRGCVNPSHLEPVTHAENVRRHIAAVGLDVRCGRGHTRTTENTRIKPDGFRICRTCRIDEVRRRTQIISERRRQARAGAVAA